MSRRILKWLGYLLVVTVVLAVEQLYGLPLLFFALTVLATSAWGVGYKQAWLLVIGVLLAGLYSLPLAVGVLLVTIAYGSWLVTGTVLKNTQLRLIIVSGGAVIILSILIGFSMTLTTLILLSISSLVLLLLTRIVFFVPESSTTTRGSVIEQLKEVRIKRT